MSDLEEVVRKRNEEWEKLEKAFIELFRECYRQLGRSVPELESWPRDNLDGKKEVK